MSKNRLRLNLGCGENRLEGYVNVDRFGSPDLRHDLETFPWPWEDDSVDEIVLSHVLEHLGQQTAVFFQVMREIYRISRPQAAIRIVVPHPRHDDFLVDPTHVRAVTPEGLELFSKKRNREWAAAGCANSQLALHLDVDFEIQGTRHVLDFAWQEKLRKQEITREQLPEAMRSSNNVVREIQILLRVIK